MEDPRPQKQPDGTSITYSDHYNPPAEKYPAHSPWCECSACLSDDEFYEEDDEDYEESQHIVAVFFEVNNTNAEGARATARDAAQLMEDEDFRFITVRLASKKEKT